MNSKLFRSLLIGLCIFVCLVSGSEPARAETSEGFVPQTSSARTDVPSSAVLPATGAQHILPVFAVVTVLGYLLHVRLKHRL